MDYGDGGFDVLEVRKVGFSLEILFFRSFNRTGSAPKQKSVLIQDSFNVSLPNMIE